MTINISRYVFNKAVYFNPYSQKSIFDLFTLNRFPNGFFNTCDLKNPARGLKALHITQQFLSNFGEGAWGIQTHVISFHKNQGVRSQQV